MPSYRISSQRKRGREVGDLVTEIIQSEGAALFSRILKEKARRSPRQQGGAVHEASRNLGPRFSSRKAFGDLSKWWDEVRHKGLVPVSRTRLGEALALTRRNLDAGRALALAWKRSLWDVRGYYQNLSSNLERTEFLALLALSSASFLGGIAVGSQVPQLDVRLYPIGQRSTAITVHSAALLSLEVSLEWMKAVLARAMVYPELEDADRRRLAAMIQLCNRLAAGIEKGVAAREKVARAIPLLRRRQGRVRSIPMDAQSYQVADALLSALSGIHRNQS